MEILQANINTYLRDHLRHGNFKEILIETHRMVHESNLSPLEKKEVIRSFVEQLTNGLIGFMESLGDFNE